ncbi:MAG: acyl-CoA dehydrogenase family protein [Myxococcales bacterium]|nr:acyl-CoA dehydrogenase family protein [Myxococcota bacterium]MDW8283741.1 acyl-CoA dehydrogenase family protein [Myxococcales bacterium]
MPFFQAPPTLGNQYTDDRLLQSYLRRVLPEEVRRDIEPQLVRMGELAGGELYEMQLADRLNEPRLTPYDPWGRRIDRIELTPLWRRAAVIAAEEGLVATAYEQAHGALSRIHQFALCYLFDPSSDVYTCPLAMTDGAARTLLTHGNRALIERAVPRLLSRDPRRMWTSGQWMTERTGGSDVGRSETVARLVDGQWRLYGTKWFTSAATSEMALTLARPEGAAEGSRGLALFYLETFDEHGQRCGIRINRLKDKLGTRKLPTAELELDGAVAVPVAGLDHGVRAIAPMLNITRIWNAIGAIGGMRRALALAQDYAQRRVAFGAPLAEQPLHQETLAEMAADLEGAFHLAFFAVELLGRAETGMAGGGEAELLRLVTPLSKLTTARQAVVVASEALECFGGAGYVEDTGLPRLLRDAQVLPIWEGTTNVLALDALRVLGRGEALRALRAEVERLCAAAQEPPLVGVAQGVLAGLGACERFVATTSGRALEAGARRLALSLGLLLEQALLLRHAQWSLSAEQDDQPLAAVLRLAARPLPLLHGPREWMRQKG